MTARLRSGGSAPRHPREKPRRSALRAPRARSRNALIAIAGIVVFLSVVCEGRVTETMDLRTYVEMGRGVVLHGLPYLDNGPTSDFAPLRARWNVPGPDGHTWGIYGPAYPYFAAPFLALGGVRLLTAATILLIVPIAIVTFH